MNNLWWRWAKENLFSTKLNTFITLAIFYLITKASISIFQWLVINSVWIGDADQCRKAEGACMAFIMEKARFIIFGFYPSEELWRPSLGMAIFFTMMWYSRKLHRWNFKLLRYWICSMIIIFTLLRGNLFGLSYVENTNWGGLPLTLGLSFIGLIFSYPLGILLALGRRSNLSLIKFICICHIELIRGVPLISLLFMSSVVFPLFLPDGVTIDKLLRAQVAIILFISAYLAEVVRGGLAAIPKGQYEAADSLGLDYFQKMGLIILPQALKIVIPPTVNTFISMFKDTSLVMIIALFDLMMTTKAALTDSNWLGFSVEAYFFIGVIYFIFCFTMDKYSRRLELELNKGQLQ